MNEALKMFLEELSDDNADEIWSWLDNEPNVREEMIKIICDSHQHLQ